MTAMEQFLGHLMVLVAGIEILVITAFCHFHRQPCARINWLPQYRQPFIKIWAYLKG